MSQSAESTFPFLELSRELRDSVYEHFLRSSRAPPSFPDHGGARRHPSRGDAEWGECDNYYPAEGPHSPVAPFLLACRQVSNEVKEAMARLVKSNHSLYRLDLMLLDEQELHITWLAFPYFTNDISRLDVALRLGGDVGGKQSLLRGGDGGPPMLTWALFSLMQRFLQRGPDFLAPRGQGRDMRIGELCIDVLTPPSLPAGGYAGKNFHERRKGHVSPQYMVRFLIHHMDSLLRRTRYTAPYSRLIFERIKRISFRLDGVEQQSWELATLVPEHEG